LAKKNSVGLREEKRTNLSKSRQILYWEKKGGRIANGTRRDFTLGEPYTIKDSPISATSSPFKRGGGPLAPRKKDAYERGNYSKAISCNRGTKGRAVLEESRSSTKK